ncbi:hypothetical protein D9615_005891 [Tricholomella constricta]|uniref:Uncharacterized protein n=1 Tax=Tricholomella constricta TaxID=117010 RepID=A0A8H5M393_9AGAR|nr:hypothetical protein D9615_005891 [Tricholomella constricta]
MILPELTSITPSYIIVIEMSAHNLEGPLTTDSLGTKGLPFVPGSLHLTTSKHTGRYDATATVEPENMRIEPGMFVSTKEPVPNYLPPQWSAHVHPEGQLYFYRHAELRVVTEAYIYAPQIMEKVIHWVREIEALLLRKQVVLSDDIELFLQIDDNDCAYYFIDHLSHTEFWLDAADTETLCLLPAVTPSHLRLALQELYWIHVEYFPMHTKGLAPSVIEELITIFSHALADHMTSRTSTFPYAESDCAKFLKLLRGSRSQVRDGHTICVIARLWHLITIDSQRTTGNNTPASLETKPFWLIPPKRAVGFKP